jgi:hypothetical protein
MAHAETCPVCHGTGKYLGNTCHGCHGKGWIEVNGERHIYPNPDKFPDFPRPRTKRIIWI